MLVQLHSEEPQRIQVLCVDDVALGTEIQILNAENAATPWNAH